jgi:hypothetical protein
MPILRRVNVHGRSPLQTGPARVSRQGRSATAAIAGTAVVAILAVLVVVLSYRVGHRGSSVSFSDVSAVEARVDALSGQMADLQKQVHTLAKRSTPARATTAKADRRLAACLTQIQREVDDLQAYLAYRTPPRRDRVSGSCLTLLRPRFKG